MDQMESCVPPGFRFHPTEEELVGYYLKRKINSLKIDLDVIVDIDLYKMEPWDMQARCKLGYDEQNEWYFFSHKDRKYPTGTRTNRATAAGFWKATGRDKAVISKNRIIGMRKTLVFYKGRAPNGRKTDWIMHEYRLQTTEHGPPQEEGWVVCRAFKKPSPNQNRQGYEAWSHHHAYYVNNVNNHVRPSAMVHPNQGATFPQPFGSEQEMISSQNTFLDTNSQIMELPQLDSPGTLSPGFGTEEDQRSNGSTHQFIDWKNLDNLLASQVNDGTSSFSLPSFPSSSSIPQNYELEAHNINHHFLGCFDS